MDHEFNTNLTSKIIPLGRLSTSKWPGTVTADSTSQSLENIRDSIEDFYVPVNPSAAIRCIDGRNDPHLDSSKLGPQIPGGAPGAALAYRLGVDDSDLTRATFFDDAETMIDTFLRLDIPPGGHKDDQDRLNGVGCGALDSMEAIVANMTDPRLVEDHKRLVKSLLGKSFYRDDYLRVLGAALVLQSRSSDYFRDNSKVIQTLEDRAPGSVSVLEGAHKEAFVFVNYIENTTFQSNKFYDTFGIQAFGYDIWRSKKLAQELMGVSEEGIEYDRFIHARVMITIATLMTLTDGSQKLFARVRDHSHDVTGRTQPVADELQSYSLNA